MSNAEVRRALLQGGAEATDEDPLTRLAWRPAWSIRSRQGALKAFFDLLRGKA